MAEQASAKKRKLLPDPPSSVPKSRDLRDVIVAAKARNLTKLAQDAVAANMSPVDQTAAIQSMVRVAPARDCVVPAAAFVCLCSRSSCMCYDCTDPAVLSTGGGLQSLP